MPDTIERQNTCERCMYWHPYLPSWGRCSYLSGGGHGRWNWMVETGVDVSTFATFGCNWWQPRDSWGGSDRDEG